MVTFHLGRQISLSRASAGRRACGARRSSKFLLVGSGHLFAVVACLAGWKPVASWLSHTLPSAALACCLEGKKDFFGTRPLLPA